MQAAISDDQERLFASPHAALVFAYNFSSEQYDRPAMNKMGDEPAPVGKGLVGTDGAAQAGFIQKEVATLGPLHEAIVIATYAPRKFSCECHSLCCCGFKRNAEWQEAIGKIALAAAEKLSGKLSNYRLRVKIVESAFGMKVKIQDMAEYCRVDRNTAAEHNAIVTQWLKGVPAKHGKPAILGEVEKALDAAAQRIIAAGMAW